MRKFIYLVSLLFVFGCDSENALDCVQASGDIVQQEFDVDFFDKIIVWKRVQLIVKHGETQSVVVETGDNLLNEIRVRVEDSILKVSDRNSCNFVRDYGITKVYVTSPDLKQIRNSSGLTARSDGVLKYQKIILISEDPNNEDEFHIDGDFDMDFDVTSLQIKANGLSKFYVRGKALFAGFFINDQDVRIEGADLEIENLYLFHRGTNKMIVNPQSSIRGIITSLGDVIAKNQPPIVDVEERYTGKLIFE